MLKDTEGEERSRAARAECHLERGIIYQKQRDYKRSADELLKATELDPTNPMVGTGTGKEGAPGGGGAGGDLGL